MVHKITYIPDEEPTPEIVWDQSEQVPSSSKIPLKEDLHVNPRRNTEGHHQYDEVAWAKTETITIHEPDVDPEEVAETLRHELGTQVDVQGGTLTVHLLSAKIRRRLQEKLNSWLGNDEVHSDNTYSTRKKAA